MVSSDILEAGTMEAKVLEVQVVNTRKTVLGVEHLDILLANMNNYVSTLLGQGQWKEAGKLFIQAVDMHKTVLGAEHPDTLASTANLTLTYGNQGR